MKSSSQTNIVKKIAEKKYNRSLLKRRPSKRLKTLVWEKKFTLDVGRAKCPCCQKKKGLESLITEQMGLVRNCQSQCFSTSTTQKETESHIHSTFENARLGGEFGAAERH